MRHDGHGLRFNDWFCGAGGSTQAAALVPYVQPTHAANHWPRAIESHAANHPEVDHWLGDIREIDVARLPYAELFWASPECPQWSQANGKARTYADLDVALPGFEPVRDVEAERSRALMEEVPLYLRAMARRGKPVLAGVVENVVDVRSWTDWDRWVAEIRAEGYRTRVIALNSMHAESQWTPRAPQSRDRLYLAYWHTSIGRDPDWNKWLRPRAWCPTCEETVRAVQVFKREGADMGRYRSQYVYRCPRTTCRNRIVEPEALPAYTAIDWALRGERIGDRTKALAPKTISRIEAGLRRYARPLTLATPGYTYERHPAGRTRPVDAPLTTMTTTDPQGLVVPPLVVPVEGREGKVASSIGRPLRTQSTRAETALVVVDPVLVPAGGTWNDSATSVASPMRTRTVREAEALVVAPFVAELRGGGSVARPVADPLATMTASGTHHGLVVPPLVMRNNLGGAEMSTSVDEPLRTLTAAGHQSLVTAAGMDWATLYAYDQGAFRSLLRALPTQTSVEGDGLLTGVDVPAVEDCSFRMLEPHEIGAAMAFLPGYIVKGNRRERVRQYGNAVTPPASEVLVCALVEAITGEEIERS